MKLNRKYTAALAASLLLVTSATAHAAEAFLPVKTRAEVLLPPDSQALAWRHDMKMGGWTGGCSGSFYELNTPELIERRVKEMQAQGFNTIIMSGLHMHNCFLHRWARVTQHTARVVAAAHARGMKVVFHHDVPVLDYNGRGLHELIAHPDWLARDIEHDRPTFRRYCILNPGFRKAYADRMTTLVRETDLDGVMLDEASFPGKQFCGCEHCRRAFTEQTGLVLPRGNTSKVFYNKNDPLWVEWVKWRKRAVGDWWIGMRKAFNTVKRDLCIMLYTTHGGFSYYAASVNYGSDLIERARACDFLGTEIMARNVYDLYRPVFAFRKAKAALGALYDIPIWGLVYHVDDPTFAYFGWAMNHMNRQTTWMSAIEGEDTARYLDWPGRMNARRARPVADVAILLSSACRDFGRLMGAWPDGLGVSQCLTDAHVQNDFILDDALLDARTLGRYKLLVLASVGNMNAEQARAVREYVEAGGRLLVTGHTSLVSENGFVQKTFQLADVMGVDYTGKRPLRSPRTIRVGTKGDSLVIPGAVLRVKARPGAEVLATVVAKTGKPIGPAVVANRFGRGRCVYAACQLGGINCEREQKGGRPQRFAKNPDVARLLVRLVHDAAGRPFDFQAVRAPEKVVMAVCKQQVDGKTDVLVHLLNAIGAGVAKGEVVPIHKDWSKSGGPFPALTDDLRFDIRCGAVTQARIVSPDYKGARPVALEPRDNGFTRVTVGKADLKAYGTVYLTIGPGNTNKR